MSMLCSSVSGAGPVPGGNGMVPLEACIATGTARLPTACVRGELHYKLEALMGEPTVHFGLRWRLESLSVAPAERRDGTQLAVLYAGTPQFSQVFGERAQSLQLMAAGFATVRRPKGQSPLALAFDTGAPTVPGKMSWDVAGSPDWNKLLFGPAGCGELASAKLNYLPPAAAKNLWAAGNVALVDAKVCPKGTLFDGLTELVAAVEKYCSDHTGEAGIVPCGKGKDAAAARPATRQDNPLDALPASRTHAAERGEPAVRPSVTDSLDSTYTSQADIREMNRLRAEFDRQTRMQCESTFREVQRCQAATPGCAPKQEKEINACLSTRCGSKPSERYCPVRLTCGPGISGLCIPWYCPTSMVENEAFPIWQRCTEAANDCRVDTACVQRCNPQDLKSVDDCIARQKKNAPTMEDARKANSKPALRTQEPVKNYLD